MTIVCLVVVLVLLVGLAVVVVMVIRILPKFYLDQTSIALLEAEIASPT